ncbi:sodium-dependent phosphate transporter [Streptococcus pneumoniae]|uniref:Sodium-dependent phosphate transporter n=1 Tax=Streptococcus pneumoniae TaxID=1313 RepID=A0AA95D9I6_STREE|nr:sodium-dependent phosphate transporter [Streptococcus pneumoniae]COH25150.1 sodium-dependent phosphate transporter [Streptococcus pneumoniae]COK45552.1 sodium-dependent phosphate transporter [Streptococcus pneumoniae]VKI11988.1 sodium-dependent phosphate transporter [Streptococcus pneumoniae]VLM23116.1 sodium-dependent phosphate transporter [Streptococcus pneumoniae]
MSINWQEILFHFLGGLGLFLYSIKTMGDGLQQAAGDRLRFYIDKYTSNPFFGVLVGIGMTALIQSSSGVTVITVGLVSAGLLTLRQAIGIVMGANIGTTVTSFLIGFKLGNYSLSVPSVSFLQKIGQSIISDVSSLVSVVSFLPSIS